MSLWSRFIAFLKAQPSVALWVCNAAVACLSAFGVGAAPTTTAAITAVVSGLITVITAFAVHPVSIPTVTGALATVAQVMAANGWIHATSAQIGTSITVLSIALALLLHQAIRIKALGMRLVEAQGVGRMQVPGGQR